MEKKEKKVPDIKFPGFGEDWEQRKFGDDNDLITGYPFESEKFAKEGINLIRGMNVKRGVLDLSADICMKWESSEGLESYLLKDGDILIQMDGALIGKSYARISQNQLPALLVQRVTRARTDTHKASADFMYQSLQRGFLAYIKMNKTETAVPHLSLNDIRDFTIMAPSLAEQEKIGSFFATLDNAITLHQHKLDQMKECKSGMLQKMFPRDGEAVPEIRFPGFTDDWEQRKVGDLFTFVKQKNGDNAVDNVITNSAEYGLIPQRDFFDKDIAVEGHTNNYTVISKGDFVYNPRKSTSAPFGPFNCYMLEEKGIVSPLYTCLSLATNDCTDYLLWYFKTDKWYPYIQLNGAQGGARHDRVGMTNELMNGIPVSLPSYEEQKCIAAFLTTLDQTITLHHRKLEQLKEYKKGLLQKMFV